MLAPIEIKVKKLKTNAILPTQANSSDSGWDLVAISWQLKTEKVVFMDTGLAIEPPAGYYTEIYPRSSIYKTNFILANSVGIIDNTYRGSLLIPLLYLGPGQVQAAAPGLVGKRIAQIIVRPLIPCLFRLADDLQDSPRSHGGFGSSGE